MTDFSKLLSRRARDIEEPAIIRMAQKARDMREAGHDVVSLTIGEPDFDTPMHIQEAAAAAMASGNTHYSPMPGRLELRKALSEKLKSENNLDYGTDEIVICNGAKQALTNAFFALIDDEDEAVLIAPYWGAYAATVDAAGGKPIVVTTTAEEGFKVSPQALSDALSARTKFILLNSPCNPSGAVYTREELQALSDVVLAHPHVMVIADEIYEYITYGQEHVSIGSLAGMRERVLTINGFSKGFAMTGWRLGYVAAPREIASACARMQGMFTAGANPFVQLAGVEALKAGREDCERMTASYARRRDIVVRGLQTIPGINVRAPDGTFYIFPEVSTYLGTSVGNRKIETADDLCMWLLEDHGVALVPGGTFGAETCIRISFAASEEDIEEGMKRLAKALALLNPA